MHKKLWITAACLMALGSLVPALGLASSKSKRAQTPDRQIYLSAVEWKGSANVSKEPYPGPVPAGGGYESYPPGHEEVAAETGKWAIETYRFDSAMVAAYVGDRVTLNIFGVNGKQHDIAIPAFNKTLTVKRGVVSKVSFVVKKAGIYKILCITHPPVHQADLLVLDKPKTP